jgi:hypothetical protein
LQDVAQGPGGAVHFPVPWADTPALSFLRSAAETRALLEAAGFTVLRWDDNSAAAIAETAAERARMAAQPGPRPPLGLHLVLGPSFAEKTRNGQRNLAEGRVELINAVLARG